MSLDQILDEMDGLFEEFNNPKTPMDKKLKAQVNLLSMELDMERNVCKNHEKMLHLYDQRVHELDDKVDRLETQLYAKQSELDIALSTIRDLQAKLERQKKKRKMENWIHQTIEEYQDFETGLAIEMLREDEEEENLRKRLKY